MITQTDVVNLVTELAMEAETGDFPESMDRSATYYTMASNIVENYYEKFDGNLIAMATVTALVVENLILILKLSALTDQTD